MTRPFYPPVLDDGMIEDLLREPKHLPADWRKVVRPTRIQARHRRAQVDIVGQNGRLYELHSRLHLDYPSNFSAILIYRSAEGPLYVLVRCNGLHPGGHRNRIEGTDFATSFHVHKATQRYQDAGLDIDGFATQDSGFTTLSQAMDRMVGLANLVTHQEQGELF